MKFTRTSKGNVAGSAAAIIRSMGAITVFLLGMVLVRAEEPKDETKLQHQLVGTWTLISAKYGGQEFKPGEGVTTVKHVTPTQFMWASYGKDGKVTRAAGGSYTLNGDTYEETPGYGISADFDLIKGNAQTFKCRIEGNKWYHNGKLSNGLTIDEVWERVEKKK